MCHILTKLNYSPADISNVATNSFHLLWLNVQVKNMKSVLVCAIYRPPDVSIDCFDTDHSPNLVTASSLNKPIYIIRDINCSLLKPNIPGSVALMNFCRMFNLTQMVSSPTRVTDSTATLLDVIITSNANQFREVKIIECSVSDHDLVYAILRLKKQLSKPVYITTRYFKHYHPEAFYEDIEQAPWSVLDVFDDVNDKLFAFNELFCDIVDRHAPIKKIKILGRPLLYVTDEIGHLMRAREDWRKIARKTNDPCAWSVYKSLKREVKNEIRVAEREFMMEQIKNNKNNTNYIWKTIRSYIPNKSKTQKTYSKAEKTVANEFNYFFAGVGDNTLKKISDLASKFNFELNNNPFIPRTFALLEQITFNPIECKQVQAIVNSMAKNKAPGIDKIPVRVIKNCLPAILRSLTSIINASFTTNTFPDAWKLAEVTPVLKSGDHEVPNNNRPISLLPVLSKVCERTAFNQFTAYLDSKELLTSKQSGNKQHHSTETTLIHTTDQILRAIDNKQLTATVLLDMSKAFDSLHHGILLTKLQDVGASTTALQRFRSYHVTKLCA